MDLKITSDALTKHGIAKEYTDITITLLKEMIKISGQSNFLMDNIIGTIITYQSKDPEWFVRLTAPFFMEYRNKIMSKNIEFFINNDYKDQMLEWNNIFGKTISAQMASIIINGIKNIAKDTAQLQRLFEYMFAILRKSAKYIIMSRDEAKVAVSDQKTLTK